MAAKIAVKSPIKQGQEKSNSDKNYFLYWQVILLKPRRWSSSDKSKADRSFCANFLENGFCWSNFTGVSRSQPWHL